MSKDLKSLTIFLNAHQSVMTKITQSLRGWDLNVNEFAALEALATKGSLTTQQLINTVLIPNSSMSYVITNLATKGYLSRTKDLNDKRIQYLSLTDKGKDYFEQVYAQHLALIRPMFEQFSVIEENQLQKLLKHLDKYEEQ